MFPRRPKISQRWVQILRLAGEAREERKVSSCAGREQRVPQSTAIKAAARRGKKYPARTPIYEGLRGNFEEQGRLAASVLQGNLQACSRGACRP